MNHDSSVPGITSGFVGLEESSPLTDEERSRKAGREQFEAMAELARAILPEEIPNYKNRLTAQQCRQARNLAKTFLATYDSLKKGQ